MGLAKTWTAHPSGKRPSERAAAPITALSSQTDTVMYSRSSRQGKVDLGAFMAELLPLLEAGEATRGLRVERSRGGLVLFRHWLDEPWADPVNERDRRFRLTPLGGRQAGLSLWRRERWETLPFQGTLRELVDLMNTALAPWASEH